MIAYLLILFGLGDLAGLVHFVTHHRTGLTGAVLALAAWVGHRLRRRFKHTGRRIAPPEVQRALKAARRAGKAATA